MLDDLLLSSRVLETGAEFVFRDLGRVIFEDYNVKLVSKPIKDDDVVSLTESMLGNKNVSSAELFIRKRFLDTKNYDSLDSYLDFQNSKDNSPHVKVSYGKVNALHISIKPKDYFSSEFNKNNRYFKSPKFTTLFRWDYPVFRNYKISDSLAPLLLSKHRYELSLREFSDVFDFSCELDGKNKSRFTSIKRRIAEGKKSASDAVSLILTNTEFYSLAKDYAKLNYGFFENRADLGRFFEQKIISSLANLTESEDSFLREVDSFVSKGHDVHYTTDYSKGNLRFSCDGISMISENDFVSNFKGKKSAFMDVEIPLYKEKDNEISWNSLVFNDSGNIEPFELTKHKFTSKRDWLVDGLENQMRLIYYTARLFDEKKPFFAFAYNYKADFGEMKKRGGFSFGDFRKDVIQSSNVKFFERLTHEGMQLIDLFAFMKIVGKGLPNLKLETVARHFLGKDRFGKSINYDEMEIMEKFLLGRDDYDISKARPFVSDALSSKKDVEKLLFDYSMNDSVVLNSLVSEKFGFMFDLFENVSKYFGIPPDRAFTFSSAINLHEKTMFEKMHVFDDFDLDRVRHDYFYDLKKEFIKNKADDTDLMLKHYESVLNKSDISLQLLSKIKKMYDSALRFGKGTVRDYIAKFRNDFVFSEFPKGVKDGFFRNVDLCYVPFGYLISDVLSEVYGKNVSDFSSIMRSEMDKKDVNFQYLAALDNYLTELAMPIVFDFMEFYVPLDHVKKIEAAKSSLEQMINNDFDLSYPKTKGFKKHVSPGQFSLMPIESLLPEKERKVLSTLVNSLIMDLDSYSSKLLSFSKLAKKRFVSKYSSDKIFYPERFIETVKDKMTSAADFLYNNSLSVVSSGTVLYVVGVDELSEEKVSELSNYAFVMNHVDRAVVVNHKAVFKENGYFNLNVKPGASYHYNSHESFVLRKVLDFLLLGKNVEAVKEIERGREEILGLDINSLIKYNQSKGFFMAYDSWLGDVCFFDCDAEKDNVLQFLNDLKSNTGQRYEHVVFSSHDALLSRDGELFPLISREKIRPVYERYEKEYDKVFKPYKNYADKMIKVSNHLKV